MKNLQKLLALLLVLALVLSLAVPATAAAESELPLAQILKMKNGGKSPATANTMVYPYAQSFGTAVVKGDVAMLEFKLAQNRPSTDKFGVMICRGSYEDLEYLDESDIVEERIYKMSDFQNGSIAMTWKADSRYPVGAYVLIGVILDKNDEAYMQDYYAVDLYVVNDDIVTQGMEIMGVSNGEYYHFDGHLRVDTPVCIAYAMQPHTGKRTTITVEVDNPALISASVDAGYVYLTGKGYGRTSVTIRCGYVEQRVLLAIGYYDLTGFDAIPEKTDLCVGMTDNVSVRYDNSHLPCVTEWRSEDTAVVTVNNHGVVTAVGPGTTNVIASCAGITDTITYTVTEHDLPEGLPVSQRTATKPAMIVGPCSICGQDNAVTIVEEAIFTDTDYKAWYSDHVDYVYEQGLMNGFYKNFFGPEEDLSRSMVVTVLYRAAGSPEVTGEIPFTDVEEGKWYSDAILWASQNEVVNGVGHDRFDPDGHITREQIATILYRYTNNLGMEMAEGADLDTYPDSMAVSGFAREGMAWAVAEGLITGTVSDGVTSLSPWNTASRAQLATIISRYQQMFQ